VRFLLVGRFHGHPVRVHWSVPVVAVVILAFNYRTPLLAIVSTAAYFVMLLIHEAGHAAVARLRHCTVTGIELHPFGGGCRYVPNSADDRPFIAWGGALAQFAVAIPIVVITKVFGGTGILAIDHVLVILGFLSPAIAVLNLVPVSPFDGSRAWFVIPILFGRVIRFLNR
jgi:Zn-dependent protease